MHIRCEIGISQTFSLSKFLMYYLSAYYIILEGPIVIVMKEKQLRTKSQAMFRYFERFMHVEKKNWLTTLSQYERK